jgi:hypothetical protein
MSTTPPIIPGCVSFSECIDQSREYAIKVDIDAIESTARTLLLDQKGVDGDIMSRHISMIKEKRLGSSAATFLWTDVVHDLTPASTPNYQSTAAASNPASAPTSSLNGASK